MILEVAQIDIRDGGAASFESAIEEALGLLEKSRGFRGARLYRSHEVPDRYRLLVEWDSIENHVIDFQQSNAFASWRALLKDYFAGLPTVEHMELVTHRGETPSA